MKKKIYLLIVILLINLFIYNKSYANDKNTQYTIDKYDIDMKVNENNTYDITEKITVNYAENAENQIIIKIPLKTTKTTIFDFNKSNVSNIEVNDSYSAITNYNYKILKIGNKKEKENNKKTYEIKYTYDGKKDTSKTEDNLFYYLIYNENETKINNVEFTITMPKKINKSNIKISNLYSKNIEYKITDNVIKGSIKNGIKDDLYIDATLPEGYFVGIHSGIDLEIIASIFLLIFGFRLYQNSKRNNIENNNVIEMEYYYPPHNLNTTTLGYIYKGYSEEKDVTSLLLYLANKGYLKIESLKKREIILKHKNFKIIKLKEYDGDNQEEKKFLDDLFLLKDEITSKDLVDRFYYTIFKISKSINKKENNDKYTDESLARVRLNLLVMIVFQILIMGGVGFFSSISNVIDILIFVPFSLGAVFYPLLLLYKMQNKSILIIAIATSILTGFLAMEGSGINIYGGILYLAKFILESISLIILIILYGTIKTKNTYGLELLHEIESFKKCLKNMNKSKIEELLYNDSEYFYEILPYTYVLGISKIWIKKFEEIELKPPKWYEGSTSSECSFAAVINSMYLTIVYYMAKYNTHRIHRKYRKIKKFLKKSVNR